MSAAAAQTDVILHFDGVLLFVGIEGTIGFTGLGDRFHVLLLEVHGDRDVGGRQDAGTDVELQFAPKRGVLLDRTSSFGHVVRLVVHRAVNSNNYFLS
jgi:hypothetical protein